MSELLRIELLKIRTTRATYGLLACGTALTALVAILRASRAGNGHTAPLSTTTGLTTVLTAVGFGLVLATVFGVTVSSGEFRHGTATSTYLATPNRRRVMIAKLVAGAGFGLVFGALASGVTCCVGLGFAAAGNDGVALSAPTILGYGGGTALACGALAAVGVALGTLVRSQIAAVAGVFIWSIFAETIVGGVFNGIGPFLPFTAADTMAGARLGSGGFGFSGSWSTSPLPFAAATGLLFVVAVILAATAAHTTLRADIT